MRMHSSVLNLLAQQLLGVSWHGQGHDTERQRKHKLEFKNYYLCKMLKHKKVNVNLTQTCKITSFKSVLILEWYWNIIIKNIKKVRDDN